VFEWKKSTQITVPFLVKSKPSRLDAIVRDKGGRAKYGKGGSFYEKAKLKCFEHFLFGVIIFYCEQTFLFWNKTDFAFYTVVWKTKKMSGWSYTFANDLWLLSVFVGVKPCLYLMKSNFREQESILAVLWVRCHFGFPTLKVERFCVSIERLLINFPGNFSNSKQSERLRIPIR